MPYCKVTVISTQGQLLLIKIIKIICLLILLNNPLYDISFGLTNDEEQYL